MAAGGFGAIYQARDIQEQNTCVVKLLKQALDSLADGKQRNSFAVRFQREIKVTSLLSERNPHIVRILDHGKAPEYGLFYAMEMLEGDTLKKRMHRGLLPLPQAMHIIRQLCNAIQEAHDNDIVHRDLKPDNIFLIKYGDDPHFVKLLDFGIAKTLVDTLNASLTQGILGTPQYLSPEQCSDGNVTVRSDIYALGIIIYELLTGAPPFTSETPLALLRDHITKPPKPPTASRPDLGIPKELDAVVLKALAKDPEHRYESAWALWEALMPFASDDGFIAMRSHDELPAVLRTQTDDALAQRTVSESNEEDIDAEGPTEPIERFVLRQGRQNTPPTGDHIPQVPSQRDFNDDDEAYLHTTAFPYKAPNKQLIPEMAILETVDGPEKLGAFISKPEELPQPMAVPHALDALSAIDGIDDVEIIETTSKESLDQTDRTARNHNGENPRASAMSFSVSKEPPPLLEAEPALPPTNNTQKPLLFAFVGAFTLVFLSLWAFRAQIFGLAKPSNPIGRSSPATTKKLTKRPATKAQQPKPRATLKRPLARKATTVAKRPSPLRKTKPRPKRRANPRRMVRKKPKPKTRNTARRQVPAARQHPQCGNPTQGHRWVVGTMVTPANKTAQLTFLGCSSCRVSKRAGRYCLSLPIERKVKLQIRAEGYQFCTHFIGTKRTSLRWTLRVDDPDALAVEQYQCFR